MFAALSREYTYISSIARSLYRMRHVKPDAHYTISDIVEDIARRMPHNPAILYQDQTLDYAALDGLANRYAHWALQRGIAKGDVVALFIENRPEYVAAWLGLVKLGAVVALVNTNLRTGPLAHSINIAGAKHLVLGSELADAYREALPAIENPPLAWLTGPPVSETLKGSENLDSALAAESIVAPDPSIRAGLTCHDVAFDFFTSGTTGLPKAANFSHMRMLFMMYGFAGGSMPPLRPHVQRVAALSFRRRRLRARARLDDGRLHHHQAKILCARFLGRLFHLQAHLLSVYRRALPILLNASPHVHERDHRLRAITGNGLRAEIWPQFQSRFAIPKIIEFYGATEGNVSMLNYDGKVGAVGRVPSYMRRWIPTRIVRFDIEKEIPVRGADGFCIECPPGEAGEAIGQITNEPEKISRATRRQRNKEEGADGRVRKG